MEIKKSLKILVIQEALKLVDLCIPNKVKVFPTDSYLLL